MNRFLNHLFRFRERSIENKKITNQKGEKPFLDHLEDLRWMFIKIVVTLTIFMVASFCFRSQLTHIIQAPLGAAGIELEMISLKVHDSFTLSFRIAFYAGFILSFPFILFFIAQFVLPGLTHQEKKLIYPGVIIGFSLFLIGVVFFYFVVLPRALEFFFADAKKLGWEPRWTVRDYYSFVTHLTLVFGLCFELPVFVMSLVKLDLLTYALMRNTRRYAIIVITAIAAIITPTTDLLTLLCLAGPMVILYEICIWLAWGMQRKEEKQLGDEPTESSQET